jgi:hypothetical protein
MSSTYERLREIKHRRVEIASNDLRTCRVALEQAARVAELARQQSSDFSRTLASRQAVLYDELQQRPRLMREIDEVRDQIARLRRIEGDLRAKAAEAEQARARAMSALEAAQQAHQQAVKTREKFDQLIAIERRHIAAAEQLNEDREMDEFLRPADSMSDGA